MPRKTRGTKKKGFSPVHPIADFTPIRKPIDLLKKSRISLADIFPPGIKLSGNETKVLTILRLSVVGDSNIAAIDQIEVAKLASLQRPHVTRAISGLRKKGLLVKTWMEEGYSMFRNIYALWVPPELLERDAEKQTRRKNKALDLEKQAKELQKHWPADKQKHQQAQRLLKRANNHKEKVCVTCRGMAMLPRYIPSLDIEKWKWCSCSLGRTAAQQTGSSMSDWIDSSIVEQFLSHK